MKKILTLFLIFTPLFLISQTQIGSDINGVVAGDRFGYSVSLSTDGNIIAITASSSDGNGSNSGHASIFRNNNGVWEQIGSDINGEASGDKFGNSVGLSSDGNIIIVGAPNNDVNGSDSGHVRVFLNNNGVWEQIGNTINGEAAEDFFGYSVSINSDGSIIAVGAPANDGNGSDSGYVRVFINNNGVWEQIGSNILGKSTGDNSGISVSLSSNGNVLAIGSWLGLVNGSNPGHVRVFRNNSGVWEQIGSDINGVANNDALGDSNSISLSSDGNVIAVGARLNDGNGETSGHVRVYQNNNGNWEQIGLDINGEVAGDQSGGSLSLSSDGSMVAIGATRNSGNGLLSGHVRVYQNNNGVWEQIGLDLDGEASGDRFGWSVNLSSDSKTLAIGAILNDGNGLSSGHVRVYNLSTVLNTTDFLVSKFRVYPNPVTDSFTIQLQENIQFKKVSIYNSLGKFIKSSKKLKTDTSTFAKGIYIIEIETNKGKASKKLVIE